MKNVMKISTLNLLLGAAMILLTTACGKIPAGYQGDFVDAASGTKITLGASEGVMKTTDGRELKGKAEDLSFENLQEGKQAIYLGQNTRDGNMFDVFWLNPNLTTRQESNGLVWFQSEVIYTMMNAKQEQKVDAISLFRCKDGQVILDTVKQRMTMGCPAGPEQLNMVRASDKKDEKKPDTQINSEIQRN